MLVKDIINAGVNNDFIVRFITNVPDCLRFKVHLEDVYKRKMSDEEILERFGDRVALEGKIGSRFILVMAEGDENDIVYNIYKKYKGID